MRKVRNYLLPHEENDFKPLLFTEVSLLTIALGAVLLFASSVTTSHLVKNSSLFAGVYSSVLIDLTNSARAKEDLPILTKNVLLEEAAQLKANDMATKKYFAHTSPEGITPWFWLTKVGYHFLYAGENLAEGFNESSDVNKGWLNSPSHKANIISPHFTDIGIATAKGNYKGSSTVFVVEYFGQQQVPQPTKLTTLAPTPTEANNDSIASAAQVLGATAEEVEVDILTEDENFIGVKNASAESLELQSKGDLQVFTSYSSPLEKMLVNESYIVEKIFTVLMIIVLSSLILFITIELRHHHRRYAFYGIAMVGFLSVLLVLNHSLILIPHT